MLSSHALLFAVLGGVAPALVWLFLWLREDSLHPEPKRTLFFVFALGAVAVAVALPFEQWAGAFAATGALARLAPGLALTIVSWAVIEELLKYGAAWLGGVHTRANDEPLDPLIYLITAALGFAAVENALFLLSPHIAGAFFPVGIATSGVRAVGSTLLHVVSSSAIGLSLALSFYKPARTRVFARAGGIIAAIVIHALFNLFLLEADGSAMFAVFASVWLAAILLLVLFEKVKRVRRGYTQSP